MDAIVAIMAIQKILLIPIDHNCCNYGNSEKRNYMNLIDRNCCNYATSENDIVDS